MGLSPTSTGSQRLGQLASQFSSALHIKGLIDGLVHDVPFPLTWELSRQLVADPFRTPPLVQTGLHVFAEL